jgi:hypothetical protein
MDPKLTDTIDMHGDPLAFRFRHGRGRSLLLTSGRDVIKVEARQMAGHQKEAVVTEGADASAWRLTSDEGKHLRGTDLAPFLLGFFNAGMQSDLYGRIRAHAARGNIALDDVAIRVTNHYWLTGSFIHGTGEGHARRSSATPSRSTSTADGGKLRAAPTLRAPMPVIPIASMRAHRAPSTSTGAAT